MAEAKFSGRKILVCGGATGIGAEVSRLLAAEGAEVCVQYRGREVEARALCDEISASGQRATPHRADLSEDDQVRSLVDGLGGVDGFVHSVSAPLPNEPFEKTAWAGYQAHWDASVKTSFLLLKNLLSMKEPTPRSGVFILSTVTFGVPPKNMAAYTAAKYGLLGLIKGAAAELAPRGIRLNAVSPGFTETPLTAHVEQRQREMIARGMPMKRLGTARDAASAVAYLLGDESGYVTGVNLCVGGGTVM